MLDPEPRIALVHPWVAEVRGAERAFFEIARAFPKGDIFFLHSKRSALPEDIRDRVVGTSFLDRWPATLMPYRSLLPMLPLAAESLDLTSYDLIISSSFGWTHGVIPADGARHISYMHSPPRYLWGTRLPVGFNRLLKPAISLMLHYARIWDVSAVNRVSMFISNSSITSSKISQRYHRNSEIIYPAVDTHQFHSITRDPNGHLLAIGELTPYKRFDLAIEAARSLNRRLVIVGDGPQRSELERLAAGTKTEFAGRVSDSQRLQSMEGAAALLHPGVEDFGIVMVEALAAGIPVVGANRGGASEIITSDLYGCLADIQSDKISRESVTESVSDVLARSFDPQILRARAEDFGIARFADELKAAVKSHLSALP